MGAWDLVLFAAMLVAISFQLGATVMWAWEVRDHRVQPLWFVITRWLTFVVLIAFAFFRPGVADGNAFIDATWTFILGAIMLAISVAGFVAELRQRRLHPPPAVSD